MRDNAVKDFFEAWAHNPDGMEGLRIWLKDTFLTDDLRAKEKRELGDTLMPLLNVCSICLIFRNILEMDVLKTRATIIGHRSPTSRYRGTARVERRSQEIHPAEAGEKGHLESP